MKIYAFTEGNRFSGWLPPKLLLVMKITTFLLLIGLLQVSAKGYSQKITLNATNVPLEKVLQSVESQSGYVFFYDSQDVKLNVNVHVNGLSVEQALLQCLTHTNLTYKIADKTIFLQKKEMPLLDKVKSILQMDITVSGTIVNEKNEQLEGVTIKFKDNRQVVVTDEKGHFVIDVEDKNAVIRISYIGYETQKLVVKDLGSPVKIVMLLSLTNLKEVVVDKGYYKENRLTSVGNVTTVTAKEIENQPIANVLQALQGRVPGLIITQTSGVPGAAINVQIRGQNSLTGYGSLDPLYVVDGVIYSPSLDVTGNSIADITGGGSPLNFINPKNIESISVLKDADATAIYGSRGGNGVILITTKKGKAGKMQVGARVESGFSFLARQLKLMNTQQYLEMRNEAFKNDTLQPVPGTDIDVDGTWDKKSYTNWQKEIANNKGTGAAYKNFNLSLSGGDVNTQYLVNANFNRQNSLYQSDRNDQNGGLSFNLNTSSTDKRFSFQLSGNYTADLNTEPIQDPYSSILNPPNAPSFFKPDGSPNWDGYTTGYFTLPAVDNIYNIYQGSAKSLRGSGVLSYKIIDGLKINLNLGYNNTALNERSAISTSSINPIFITPDFTSSATFSNTTNSTYNISPQLSYGLAIGKNKFNANFGGEYQSRTTSVQVINGYGYILNSTLNSLAAAKSIENAVTAAEQYKTASLYGRLSYSFNDKYLLNITGRRDGSSRFGPGRQYGNFGSVGAGWVFSNESFIKDNLSFLSFGKLRGSYGILGNEPGASYQYLELYNYILTLPYNGGVGITPYSLPGANFAWEKNKKQEVGIELGFLNNRIQTSVSYFLNQTSNQLLSYRLPTQTGLNNIIANLPATVQNSGLEITLSTVNIKSKNFQWRTNFNISTTHNKLLKYDGLATSPYAQQFTIGQPINSGKGFHYLGVDPATGVYEFSDGKGGKTFRPDTNRAITAYKTIDVNPKYYGGMENSFSYKNWQLDIFLQFAKQPAPNYLLSPNSPPGSYSLGGFSGNQSVELLNRWQKPGDIAKYEKFTTLSSSPAGEANLLATQSDFNYVDGSYIRVKTVALSWTAPLNWMKKIHANNVRLFVNAQNLFTITSYTGPDPETSSITSLPPLKTIVFGIDLTL